MLVPRNRGSARRLKIGPGPSDSAYMVFLLPEDRKTAITDPAFIAAMGASLHASQEEFPIKVEGTATLPYTSRVAEVDPSKQWWELKLQRALPPELGKGAIFRATLAYEGQRFEGLIVLKGREGYLRYRFALPKEIFLADRRHSRRWVFRPRENVFVTLTDGQKAASGPLTNLGLGGLGFRVDRIVHLENHSRLPLDTVHLQRGAGFVVRVQDLLKAPNLELRGKVAYTFESQAGLLVGVDFTGISDAAQKALEAALKLKEAMSRGVPSVLDGKVPQGTAKTPAVEAAEPVRPEAPPPQPLLRLRRRAVPLALLMVEGEARDRMKAGLAAEGYWRMMVGSHGQQLQASGRMIIGLEPDCTGHEGSLPFDKNEAPRQVARRIDSVMGLRE